MNIWKNLKEVKDHFTNSYGAGTDFLTVKITTGRGLTLRFHVGDELSLGNLKTGACENRSQPVCRTAYRD